MNRLPILLLLSSISVFSAQQYYVTQDASGNSQIAGRLLSRQVSAGPVTSLVGTNWTINVSTNKAAAGVMTNDTTLTITSAPSTNSALSRIRVTSTGTNTLTVAGSNIIGVAPGIVPEGPQWFSVLSQGGTNYIYSDWLFSSTNGFLKQTALGIDVDVTDYLTITTDLQADVVSLDNRVTAIEDQLGNVVYEILFGQQTGFTPVNGNEYWVGADITSSASGFTYTNNSVQFLENGTIQAISLHIRNSVGSAEPTSYSLDINGGATLITVSTNVDFSKTVTKQRVLGLSTHVTTNDWYAMKQIANTWVTPPVSVRTRFRMLFKPD